MDNGSNDSNTNSCDEAELAEHESRLYSLIHHCSDSLEPVAATINPSQDLRINPYVSASTLASVQSNLIDANAVDKPVVLRQSSGNKPFRLNQVHRIIDSSDECWTDMTQQSKASNRRNKKPRSKKLKSPYSWTSTDKPATIPKPTGVVNPSSTAAVLRNKSRNISIEIATTIDDQKSTINSFSFDLSTHVGDLFNIGRKPVERRGFRLDSRLFSKPPFKLDSKVQESHNRIFSGHVNDAKLAERSDEVTIVDVIKVKDVKHESVVEEIIVIDDDLPVLIDITERSPDKISPTIVVGRKRRIAHVVESDSDESICVLAPPCRAPPVVFTLVESSDEEATSMGPPIVPPPFDLDPQDNSFDFLDNSYDVDALAKSQARLMSNLIGSKESLIDQSLFQINAKQCDVNLGKSDKPAVSPTVPSSQVMKQSHPKQTEQASTSGSKTPPAAVPKRESSPVASTSANVPKEPLASTNSDPDVIILTPTLFNKENVSKQNARNKSPTKASKTSGSKNLVPTLNIDPDKRDKILDYIDARSKGTLVVNAQDPSNDAEPVALGKAKSKSPGPSDDDVIAIHSGTMGDGVAIEHILKVAAVEQPEERRLTRRESRKKKRKESKLRKCREKAALRRLPPPAVVYTKIEGDEIVADEFKPRRNPRSWTPMMRRFYNDSWGDEDFDHEAIKRTMSSNPGLWRINDMDRRSYMYGRSPSNRCACCGGSHHTLHCPLRTPKCQMCGAQGHVQARCPNSMCLQCGRPSDRYVNSCQQCEGGDHGSQYQRATEGPAAKRARYMPATPAKEKTFNRSWPAYNARQPYRPYWQN